MCFLGETCLTARMEMAIKTKSYFIISRCSLGKLYMAGNSRHESNSYNTSSIILIKEVSSEINYESRGEFFISSLSYCSGRHLIILRLSDCNVSYTYVKVYIPSERQALMDYVPCSTGLLFGLNLYLLLQYSYFSYCFSLVSLILIGCCSAGFGKRRK